MFGLHICWARCLKSINVVLHILCPTVRYFGAGTNKTLTVFRTWKLLRQKLFLCFIYATILSQNIVVSWILSMSGSMRCKFLYTAIIWMSFHVLWSSLIVVGWCRSTLVPVGAGINSVKNVIHLGCSQISWPQTQAQTTFPTDLAGCWNSVLPRVSYDFNLLWWHNTRSFLPLEFMLSQWENRMFSAGGDQCEFLSYLLCCVGDTFYAAAFLR